jgi:hypothetical protein
MLIDTLEKTFSFAKKPYEHNYLFTQKNSLIACTELFGFTERCLPKKAAKLVTQQHKMSTILFLCVYPKPSSSSSLEHLHTLGQRLPL